MKNGKKLLSLLILTVLAVSCVVLTSCGGPKTLEEYVNSDKELKEEIESFTTEDMSVQAKGNDLIFEYKFDEMELTDEIKDLMKSELEKQMAAQASQFESVAKQMEEETELSGITVIVKYLESDGTVLYESSYKAK